MAFNGVHFLHVDGVSYPPPMVSAMTWYEALPADLPEGRLMIPYNGAAVLALLPTGRGG